MKNLHTIFLSSVLSEEINMKGGGGVSIRRALLPSSAVPGFAHAWLRFIKRLLKGFILKGWNILSLNFDIFCLLTCPSFRAVRLAG